MPIALITGASRGLGRAAAHDTGPAWLVADSSTPGEPMTSPVPCAGWRTS